MNKGSVIVLSVRRSFDCPMESQMTTDRKQPWSKITSLNEKTATLVVPERNEENEWIVSINAELMKTDYEYSFLSRSGNRITAYLRS